MNLIMKPGDMFTEISRVRDSTNRDAVSNGRASAKPAGDTLPMAIGILPPRAAASFFAYKISVFFTPVPFSLGEPYLLPFCHHLYE